MADEIENTGAATGELIGDGQQQQQQGQAPAWMADLPDDLKADATLSRFADVPALARGHVEAHKLAKSKLAIPGEGASDGDWGKIWGALGLPEKPDGYGDFGLPALAADADEATKTARAEMVGRYQASLHEMGVPPRLASKIVAADVKRITDAQEAYYAKGRAEIDALKSELGDQYEPQKEAAKKIFTALFGADAAPLADELDSKVGSGRLMRGMMKLAKAAGEHVRIDGDGGDIGDPGDPQGELMKLNRDAKWRERFLAGDVEAVAQERRLREAAVRAASRRRSAERPAP